MAESDTSTCVHCGVPIMKTQFPSGGVWVHVPSEGPIYLLIQCNLIATPSGVVTEADHG